MATPVVIPYVFSDYSQWERKHTYPLRKPHTCTSVFKPGKNKPVREVDSAVRFLEIQIAHKRCSIEEKLQRLQSLRSDNRELVSSIVNCDTETSGVVTDSLLRYHKFKGCLSLIQDKSSRALKEAQEELAKTREEQNKEIKGLQSKVDKCTRLARKQNKQLVTLLNYKDKDYPLKLIQTEQLKAQQEYLDEKHQKEEGELESALEDARDKFNLRMEAIRLRLEEQATEEHLNKMKASTNSFEVALYNKIMEKEIKAHGKRFYFIKRDMSLLKDKIKMMKTLIRENPAHQLRISALGRCAPETKDISLDIASISKDSLLV